MNIKIINNYKSLKKDLEWNNIPNLAILTGINGCGKSQLLEYIRNNISNTEVISNFICNKEQISYLSDLINLNIKSNNQNYNTSTYLDMLIRCHRDIKGGKYSGNDSNKYVNELKNIARRRNKDIEGLEEYEIIHSRPEALSTGENFKKYLVSFELSRRKKIINAHDSEIKSTMNRVCSSKPWEEINVLLKRYNSDYTLLIPEFKDPLTPQNIGFEILFENQSSNEKIKFNELSTGEQSIIQMYLASHNKNTGESIKLLLLDEMDRYFHPTFCKSYIDILLDKFILDYGVKIILITHSLATIAFSPEESLFLMDRNSQNIKKISKNDAMSSLSNNMLSFESASKIIENILNTKNNIILLTEGKTDRSHILLAKEKLNITESIEVISCEGVTKLKDFLVCVPPALCKNKVMIGIFDYDDEGLKQFSSFGKTLENMPQIRKSKDNLPVYAIHIPVPEEEFKSYKNCPIEFLYSKEILEKFDMLGEKRSINEINNILIRKEHPYNENDYNQKNGLWFYKLKNNSKTNFSKEVKKLTIQEFKNFKDIFNLIDNIVVEYRGICALTASVCDTSLP